MSESLIDRPVEIYRAHSKYGSNQNVFTHNDGEWRISDLESLVVECDLKPFDLPLQYINLHGERFECEDLYTFMQHVRMVESADESKPIIMSHRGQILDGRHRICKAILAGKTTVKCVKFETHIDPTRSKN